MKPLKLPPQITSLIAKLKVVGKHHYFIFTIFLLCGLTAAVYLVDATLAAPADQAYHDQKLLESLDSSFDKSTIEKIESLQKSSESSTSAPTTTPGARTNPFAE